MPKPTEPPLRPLAIAVVIQGLKLHVPVTALAVLVLLLTTRVLAPEAEPALQPAPPTQRWTASSGLSAAVASMAARGALPVSDPRQKPAPCDDELGEEDIGGACWQRLPVAKCNEKKAFPHNGRCYLRVMQVAPLPREPTSGEGRPLGVADP